MSMIVTTSIPISEIENELARIWSSLDDGVRLRASLFNLVVYVSNPEVFTHYEEVAKEIYTRFPCRILFLAVDPTAERNLLQAEVSVETLDQGKQKASYDHIKIRAGVQRREELPFVVLRHLLPDLPVYLLWGEDPSQNSVSLPKLINLATRVIFDSEAVHSLSSFSEAVLSHAREFQGEISDLTWVHTTEWRRTLAAEFADKSALSALAHAELIHITYNESISPHSRCGALQALYLQGWLATQLNWRFVRLERSEGNLRLTYQTAFGQIPILIVTTHNPALLPGTITSLQVRASETINTFTLQGSGKHVFTKVSITTPEKCVIPYTTPFEELDWRKSIIRVIFSQGTSNQYLGLLKTFSQIEEFQL